MTPAHDSDQFETRPRAESDEATVEAVVGAVADVTGDSPVEIDPLGAVLDTDALNALVDSHDDRSSPATVTFDYCGYRVTATRDDVRIAPSNPSE